MSCVDKHYADHQLGSRRIETDRGSSEFHFVRQEPEETFELVLLMDVVEHVPDDRAFVSGIVQRRVRSGGCVLISVPAFASLYTRHDVALGHYRRYGASGLRTVLEQSGLSVLDAGGVFQALVPLRAVQKVAEVVRGVRSHPGQPDFGTATEGIGFGAWNGGPRLTAAVTRALQLSNSVLGSSNRGWPGLSVWALCRKP